MSINDVNSLAHSKWNCKYHIVFAPKYRRMVFYGEKKIEVGKILRQLCEWKDVRIVTAELCPDHVHMLVEIPPKMAVANFKGSRLEQWLLIYCKQNRIPYNRLTEEEKQSLIRIGSKSDFMKSHIPQREKNENEKLNTYSQFWRQKFICRYFWTPT